MPELLSAIEAIVRSAGELIRDIESITELGVKEGSANYVTRYDSMVQSYLISRLSELIPGAVFLGEEDGLSGGEIGEEYTFIIDPIDGTTNFICGFMCSAVSVGLSYRHEMLIGVVYNPFREEMFSAQKGLGSYLNNRRLAMNEGLLSTGVVNFGTAPYNPELRDFVFDAAKMISYHTMDIREIGSASIGLCYTACGRCVAYASPRLSVWDYAAASLIISEAGGILSTFEGTALSYCSGISVIASNHQGHGEFIKLIKPLL